MKKHSLPTLALVLALGLGPIAGCGGDAATPADPPVEPAGQDGASAQPGEATVAATSPETIVAAYDRALDFLLEQQKDGVIFMGEHPNIAATAMAVSAMLERPGGVRAADKPIVDKSIQAIVGSLGEDGGVRTPKYGNYMTSVVIMALAATGREDLKPHIDRASQYIKKLQFLEDGDPTYGGIGYGSDKTRSDLSNTYYALNSLRAAGVPETDPVFQRALQFLTRTQNRKENETAGEPTQWEDPESGATVKRSNDGGANYRPGDSKAGAEKLPDGSQRLRSYGSMTFALLRCYHLAGLDKSDGRVQDAVKWIAANWSVEKNPGMPDDQGLEGLYYYYGAAGKALPLAGVDSLNDTDWRADLAQHLLSNQKPDGSWTNENPRWQENDPTIATPFALMALAACAER